MQYNWLDIFFLFSIASLIALLVAFAEVQLTMIDSTVYLHRYRTHHAFRELNRVAEWLMHCALWLMTGIRTAYWLAVHLVHHTHADNPGDPHSPYIEGLPEINFHNYRYYRMAEKNPEVQILLQKIPQNWFDRRSRLGPYVGATLHMIGYGTFGFWLLQNKYGNLTSIVAGAYFGLIVYFLHAWMYILISGLVNGQAHWYPDGKPAKPGRNIWWLALISACEGNHRNHHDRPSSPCFGRGDIGWLTIRILVWLKLAKLKGAH